MEATSLMTWTEGKLHLLTCYVEVYRTGLCISKHEYMLCNAMCVPDLLSIGPLHWQKMHVCPNGLLSLTDNLTCLLLYSCSICMSLRCPNFCKLHNDTAEQM